MKRFATLVTFIAANKVDKKGPTTAISAGTPIMTCPAGYTAQGNRCAKELVQPQIPTCQEGVLQPDNTCLIMQSPQKVCPNDFVAFGNTCSRTKTAVANLSCPPGFAFESGHKKAGGVCTKSETIAQWGCPTGTFQQGELCLSEDRIPADISCPAGTTPQGIGCVRVEVYDCTTGPAYVHKHDTHGHKRVLSEVDPALMTDYLDGAVERELKKLKGNFHANNFVADKVYQQEQISVIQQKCERRVSVNPLVSCPQGVLMGRECIYSQQVRMVAMAPAVNLQTAAPVATCPTGYSPCAAGKKKVASDCCAVDEAAMQYQCPLDSQLINNMCQSVRAADWICATPGYTKHKHQTYSCAQTQYIEPTVTYNQQVTCVGTDCTEAKFSKHHGGAF